MQDRTECIRKPNTPDGAAEQAWADLSCLRQYIRPGPAEKGFCENSRLVGRKRHFAIFCSLDVQKYQN